MRAPIPFAIALLLAAGGAGLAIAAYAQGEATSTPHDVGTRDAGTTAGISFPISELGSCASKDACREYCNQTANIPACIAFGKAHGLMNKGEASRAEKFSRALETTGGPGGCTTPDACEAFCSQLSNLDTCLAFAKEHGARGEDIEQGARIAAYIQSGGTTPGGCPSRQACQEYCSDFSHAEECAAFAKNAGIVQKRGGSGGIPPGQFQKFLEAVKHGETPGGCTSEASCKAYCDDRAHHDECLAFGEKIGLFEHGQAEKLKELGGKGPGDCDSPQACRAYCNDQMHRDECYQFAVDHGFISKDQASDSKQGLVRLREGLDQSPPEVQECLKSTLGETVINDIQAGALTPGQEIGEKMKSCFQKFGEKHDPREVFRHAPPEVSGCLKEKLGADFEAIQSGTKEATPEMGDALRVCFELQRFESAGMMEGPEGRGDGVVPRPGGGGGQMQYHAPRPSEFLKNAPQQVQECLKTKFGDSFAATASSDQPSQDFNQALRGCFESFRPGAERSEEGKGNQFPPGSAPGEFREPREYQGGGPRFYYPENDHQQPYQPGAEGSYPPDKAAHPEYQKPPTYQNNPGSFERPPAEPPPGGTQYYQQNYQPPPSAGQDPQNQPPPSFPPPAQPPAGPPPPPAGGQPPPQPAPPPTSSRGILSPLALILAPFLDLLR